MIEFWRLNYKLKTIDRVTTCLENLEISGNLTAIRAMSGILLKVREMSGGDLVSEKLPKNVYCKLRICVHSVIYGMI